MGVRGLWQVVGPVAKPVKLEALTNERLAVDASIWIYQFLKAVRDGEGNALKHSHIVGFFRRICKLLFFGIKPIFVFDGGAPVLKRHTINRRRERRQGRLEDASNTAAKLLSLRLKQYLGKEGIISKAAAVSAVSGSKSMTDEELQNAVYLDQINSSQPSQPSELQKPFRKFDPYHLPEVDEKHVISRDDPRLMTEEELEEYANDFQAQISTGLYDTSKIDFNSAEFQNLPQTAQYQLLNTARLRSRLRMGYSKDQLNQLFPSRLEFSRFQIERVAQRNFLTQKMMKLLGMNEDNSQRIVGEKGGQYSLVRNENGWTLALEKEPNGPIVIDDTEAKGDQNEHEMADNVKSEDEDEDIEWEDVSLDTAETKNATTVGLEYGKELKSLSESGDELNDLFDEPTSSEGFDVLPESLQDFEAAVQRQKLYDQIKENAFKATRTMEGGSERPAVELKKSSGLSSAPPKHDRPRFLPFLLEGEGADQIEERMKVYGKEVDNNEEVQEMNQQNLKGDLGPSMFSSALSDDLGPSTLSDDGIDSSVNTEKEKPTQSLPQWFKESHKPFQESFHLIDDIDETEELVPIDKVHQVLEARRETIQIVSSDEEPEAEEKETDGAEIVVLKDRRSKEGSALDLTPTELPENKSLKYPASKEASSAGAEVENSQPQVEDQDDGYSTVAEENKTDSMPVVESNSEKEDESPHPVPLTEYDKELAEEDEKYFEEEDEELTENFVREIEEAERFTKSLNGGRIQLKSQEEYQQEIDALKQQSKAEQRDADEVTQTMISECQELLRQFGIPYITAPMEAEAQCAKLLELGLVDGIVTDDSDCFLFGGNRVLKNMFNQSKYVECYSMSDVEAKLGLDRRKLIQLAHLLGSDYTDGLIGIGPVSSLEVIAEFDSDDGLVKFREWWKKVQTGTETEQDREKVSSEFARKFKKKHLGKLILDDSFADKTVDEAYLKPEVDEDSTPFEWGRPDLDSLRTFLRGMIGWSQDKVDEVLVPVIQDMNKRQSRQTKLGEFFMGTPALSTAKRMELGSKRMQKAVERLSEHKKARKT